MSEELRQTIVDDEHLRMLSIGYLVSACLSGFFSLIGLLYIFLGTLFSAVLKHAPHAQTQGLTPEFPAFIFVVIGFFIFIVMVACGVLKLLVHQRLKQRRSRVFCMVVAGLCCLGVPYGTVLGVFTFMLLTRPSVIRQFEGPSPSTTTANLAGSGG